MVRSWPAAGVDFAAPALIRSPRFQGQLLTLRPRPGDFRGAASPRVSRTGAFCVEAKPLVLPREMTEEPCSKA